MTQRAGLLFLLLLLLLLPSAGPQPFFSLTYLARGMRPEPIGNGSIDLRNDVKVEFGNMWMAIFAALSLVAANCVILRHFKHFVHLVSDTGFAHKVHSLPSLRHTSFLPTRFWWALRSGIHFLVDRIFSHCYPMTTLRGLISLNVTFVEYT